MTSGLRSLRASPIWRGVATVAGLAVVVWLLTTRLLPHLSVSRTQSGHWQTPAPVLVLGVVTGLTYGLLGVGLVLIYRANRIINFAHGQIGAFAAAFFGIAVVEWGLPYWVALVPALVVGAGVGAVVETAVVRRLRKAPLIMSVVATLGVGQFLLLLAAAINSQASAGSVFPKPTFLPEFRIGALLVTTSYTAMLILSPIVILAVGLFLKFSRVGMGIRAAAANSEAARMAGVSASRMSSVAWGLAGVLSTLAAILTQPTKGFLATDNFGPSLLLTTLAVAVLARMRSLTIAVLAGVAVGVIEQLLLWNYSDSGRVQVALLLIILVTLLVRRPAAGRTEEKGSWATVQAIPPLPASIRALPAVRAIGPVIGVVVLGVLVLLPHFITNANSVRVTGSFGLVIVALSVGIVTGLSGQLSLGQFAVGAIGAVASVHVASWSGNALGAFVVAGLAGALVSVVIGIPALRVKGLLLTVTTLAFALVVPSFILEQDWAFGAGKRPSRPSPFGMDLSKGGSYYYIGLATLLVALLIARNVRSGGVGRRLVAVRDNEDAARAFALRASGIKLQGFALAGFIAGIGGAMYGHSFNLVSSSAFPANLSIDAVVIAVIGGLGLVTGPLLGGALVQGATFLPLDAAGLAASSFGQLLLILYLPGGLGPLVVPARDRIADLFARRAGLDVATARATDRGFGTEPTRATERCARPVLKPVGRTRTATDVPLLSAIGLVKSFGGINAVHEVSFDVARGETLGLIGPNGAGKTTTFELLAGFTRLDRGVVTYAGDDVSRLGPEARARLGLIRSFQDAALFPTLTVLECVELSLQRAEPARMVPSLLGFHGADRRRTAQARELVSWMGLDRYAGSQIQELSTGTRRIAEILCLVALQPELLLLDEPSSGVAQKETEALGELLQRLKAELDLTLIVIEHDIPLIMSLADRIVCMADGRVIASGPPEIVRTDPVVIEAYLGSSAESIQVAPTPLPSEAPATGPSAPRAAADDVAAVDARVRAEPVDRATSST